jgi:hypothetical protein
MEWRVEPTNTCKNLDIDLMQIGVMIYISYNDQTNLHLD